MPWVKLWRVEKGSFAQLPLYCRALAGEILKLTDDQGRIEIGDRAPADALAFALGATRGDRRLLRQHVPMLIDDGYLSVSDGVIHVVAWERWQNLDATTKRQRPSNDRATTEQRPNHEATTTAQRPRNESPPNPPESLGRKSQDQEEDQDPPKPPRGLRGPTDDYEAARKVLLAIVDAAWRGQHATPITSSHRAFGEVASALWEASGLDRARFETLAARVVSQWAAAGLRGVRSPWAHLRSRLHLFIESADEGSRVRKVQKRRYQRWVETGANGERIERWKDEVTGKECDPPPPDRRGETFEVEIREVA